MAQVVAKFESVVPSGGPVSSTTPAIVAPRIDPDDFGLIFITWANQNGGTAVPAPTITNWTLMNSTIAVNELPSGAYSRTGVWKRDAGGATIAGATLTPTFSATVSPIYYGASYNGESPVSIPLSSVNNYNNTKTIPAVVAGANDALQLVMFAVHEYPRQFGAVTDGSGSAVPGFAEDYDDYRYTTLGGVAMGVTSRTVGAGTAAAAAWPVIQEGGTTAAGDRGVLSNFVIEPLSGDVAESVSEAFTYPDTLGGSIVGIDTSVSDDLPLDAGISTPVGSADESVSDGLGLSDQVVHAGDQSATVEDNTAFGDAPTTGATQSVDVTQTIVLGDQIGTTEDTSTGLPLRGGYRIPRAAVIIRGQRYEGSIYAIRDLINDTARQDARRAKTEATARRARAKAWRAGRALRDAMTVDDVRMPGFAAVDADAINQRMAVELQRLYQQAYAQQLVTTRAARDAIERQNEEVAARNVEQLLQAEEQEFINKLLEYLRESGQLPE